MNVFTKKVSDLTENRKHDKAIKDLETTKQTLQKSIQNEIADIQNTIAQLQTELGILVYGLYHYNKLTPDAVAGNVNRIDGLKSEIDEKNNKIAEVCARYDDEIAMVKKLIIVEQPVAAQMQAQAACGSCKNPYTPGDDKFCMKCGNKLPDHTPTFCTGCGKQYIPGTDSFCTGCGAKL